MTQAKLPQILSQLLKCHYTSNNNKHSTHAQSSMYDSLREILNDLGHR